METSPQLLYKKDAETLIEFGGKPVRDALRRLLLQTNCLHPEKDRIAAKAEIPPEGHDTLVYKCNRELRGFYCRRCGLFVHTDQQEDNNAKP